MILPLILSAIFLLLSIIHFNWASGGKWGFEKALPTTDDGKRVLDPGKIDSFIVGLGLLAFCFFYFVKTNFITIDLPAWLDKYGGLIIPLIFIIRAVGDFRYVGFFKKIKRTEFARLDTKFYSPLCLLIGITGIMEAI